MYILCVCFSDCNKALSHHKYVGLDAFLFFTSPISWQCMQNMKKVHILEIYTQNHEGVSFVILRLK